MSEEIVPLPLPCPFCGSPAELAEFSNGTQQVRCTDRRGCGATGRRSGDGPAEAVRRWNQRFYPALGEYGIAGLGPGAIVRPFHNPKQRILVREVLGREFVGISLDPRKGLEAKEHRLKNDRNLFSIVGSTMLETDEGTGRS